MPDRRTAAMMGVLAVAFGGVALQGGHWLWLLWPSVCYATLASMYATGTVGAFGKLATGARRWSSSVLLAPHLLLGGLIWHAVRVLHKQEPPWHRIDEDLFVGRRLLPWEPVPPVDVVLDLTTSIDPPARFARELWELCEPIAVRTGARYVALPMLDRSSAPADELLAVLASVARERVYIHCAQGYGRTGMAAAILLVLRGESKDVDAALALLQEHRPRIRLSPAQRLAAAQVEPLLQRRRSAFRGGRTLRVRSPPRQRPNTSR